MVINNVDSRLYLVNDSGKIATEMEHMSTDNMVPESHVTPLEVHESPNDTDTQFREAYLEIEGLKID